MLPSSLIAPRAALAEDATAIPEPIPERPVTRAACSCCACEGNNGCDQQKAEEAAYIGCQRFFVTIFVVLTFEVISHRNNDG